MSPRAPEQNAALRAATLQRAEAAAVTLFARHGFAATSMRDIASTAGLSVGSIYRHYASKDELFSALVGQAVAGLGELIENFRSGGSPAGLITGLTRTFLSDLSDDRGFTEFFWMMNQTFAMVDRPTAVEELIQRHEELVAATVALIARGQELGEFNPGDPAELATCYLAALTGMAAMRLAMGSGLVVPPSSTLTAILIKEQR